MRILADEQIPGAVVQSLLAEGHDVTWVVTEAPGADDHEVLARAAREQRVLFTFDTDFGALVFSEGVLVPPGVVLFRVGPMPVDTLASFVARALAAREDWDGHFTVVDEHRIRMRPLPPRP